MPSTMPVQQSNRRTLRATPEVLSMRGPGRVAIIPALAAALLLAAACADDDGPAGPALDSPAGDAEGSSLELVALDCVADVGAGTLACAAPAPDAAAPPGAAGLIVGGQYTFVTLASSNVCYETGCDGGDDPGEDIFQADVTVENLIPQALGTEDGASGHAEGVRVFFTGPPVCTDTDGECGTVSVANEDGEAVFTGGDQPYFQYGGTGGSGELGADGLLSEDETSAARSWQWTVPSTVSTFEFTVYVSAAVQYPDGWVEVSDPTVALLSGGARQLTAEVVDVVGRPVPGATVEWSSSDDDVATVDESGLVDAAGAGMATITAAASGGGGQAPGTTAALVGVILVDADVDGEATHDGESWATAFPTLEDALAAAVPTTEVWIAEGTYPRDAELTLEVDGIALYGGFAGVETVRSQRDWA
ncbi:MAG: Ig-like domain-containing protein, partial [Gemmatimonadota bacterium]